MAKELGFGQPMGGIAQTAFVVPDLEQAIARWTADMQAGPFFWLEDFRQPGQVYRGTESTADIRLAMGFAGHMQIELIQPKDNDPSVYKETVDLRGHGFHHFGIACEDVERTARDYAERGYAEAFRAGVPTGGEVVYLDNGTGPQWGFLELLPVTPGMDEAFTRFWDASRGWDGSEPIRSFI